MHFTALVKQHYRAGKGVEKGNQNDDEQEQLFYEKKSQHLQLPDLGGGKESK